MSNSRKKRGTTLVVLGCCCVFAAVALYTHNVLESKRAAKSAEALTATFSQLLTKSNSQGDDSGERDKALDSIGSVETDTVKTLSIDGYDVMGQITIPAAEIDLAVISEWSYPNLNVAPCRYSGTPEDQLILLAHNYKNHFGRLRVLQPGDEVGLLTADGEEYHYEVLRKETWGGDQAQEIFGGEDWDLTLFTCTYGGESRLVIRCVLTN